MRIRHTLTRLEVHVYRDSFQPLSVRPGEIVLFAFPVRHEINTLSIFLCIFKLEWSDENVESGEFSKSVDQIQLFEYFA